MAMRVEKTSRDSPSGLGSDRVRTGSLGSGQPLNPELDFGSGSAPMLNFGPDLGLVHQSSGPDQSSEPNCGNPTGASVVRHVHPCFFGITQWHCIIPSWQHDLSHHCCHRPHHCHHHCLCGHHHQGTMQQQMQPME